MNSGFCTQTRSQERSAVRALGPGQGRLWGLGLKMGHAEERCQVLEAFLWPWLWCTDTGWLMSKCGFITGVAEGPVNPSEGPQLLFTAAGQVASLLNSCCLIYATTLWVRVPAGKLLRSFPAVVLCDFKVRR